MLPRRLTDFGRFLENFAIWLKRDFSAQYSNHTTFINAKNSLYELATVAVLNHVLCTFKKMHSTEILQTYLAHDFASELRFGRSKVLEYFLADDLVPTLETVSQLKTTEIQGLENMSINFIGGKSHLISSLKRNESSQVINYFKSPENSRVQKNQHRSRTWTHQTSAWIEACELARTLGVPVSRIYKFFPKGARALTRTKSRAHVPRNYRHIFGKIPFK